MPVRQLAFGDCLNPLTLQRGRQYDVTVWRRAPSPSPARNPVQPRGYRAGRRRTRLRPICCAGAAPLVPALKSGQASSLGVVVTGGTKSVGFALAAAFLASGDRVVIASRDPERVQSALHALEDNHAKGRVHGLAMDVSKPEDMRRLGEFARHALEGRVDVWINNAGQVGTRKNLVDLDAEDVRDVVSTNLLGALLGCREAEQVMRETGGHCFTMDGAGTGGNPTAGYAAYGATKRAVPQMVASISRELKDSAVRFHVLSPGMVLTDLLMAGNADVQARRFFNYLAEEPDTVASNLVPRIRALVLGAGDKRNTYIRFLTLPRAFLQIASGFLLGVRKNRYFDETTGQRVDKSGRYNENDVRERWSR